MCSRVFAGESRLVISLPFLSRERKIRGLSSALSMALESKARGVSCYLGKDTGQHSKQAALSLTGSQKDTSQPKCSVKKNISSLVVFTKAAFQILCTKN